MSDELPSKTQRKREMHELQALGEELVELNDEQLASIDLPERLLDAVLDARRASKHEARRRQLQYIGKIMRTWTRNRSGNDSPRGKRCPRARPRVCT